MERKAYYRGIDCGLCPDKYGGRDNNERNHTLLCGYFTPVYIVFRERLTILQCRVSLLRDRFEETKEGGRLNAVTPFILAAVLS